MFNIIEENQKFAKGIMIAVVAAFVLWGVGGYINGSSDDGYIAKVGNLKIYSQDIDNAMQQNPQNSDKMQVLLGLINRDLLLDNINANNMTATSDQLQQQIAAIKIFQDENGKFDINKYKEFLEQRVMTAQQFQQEMQQQISINQFVTLFNTSFFSSNSFNQAFAKLLSRERTIATYTISPSQFYAQINPTPQQINEYYQQNLSKFTLPERVKLSYIQVDASTIAPTIKISQQQIDQYIKQHQANLANIQIDASHILFEVPTNATSDQKAKIKAQALAVLNKVRANPKDFAKLAKQYSQDPGSASNGGDLGFFGKGVMAKPFEEAAFSLKPGQISNLVETKFGYHIIKVNAINQQSSQEITAMAQRQLQQQQATVELQKVVDKLNNLTYNNPKSLTVAAKELNLPIQNSNSWIEKGVTTGIFSAAAAQKAIFNNDTINGGNNSEVVDLGNNSYAVYHVTAHEMQTIQPLNDSLKAQIMSILKASMAANLVTNDGQNKLNMLKNGQQLNLKFSSPLSVSLLSQNPNIGPNSIKQIFTTNLSKLPAYTGSLDANNNFVIYKILGEHVNDKLNLQNQEVVKQLTNSDQDLLFSAYLNGLRNNFDVNYKVDRLNLQSK
jgi:peptidyl-prolyl cis-trans isomerase D